MTTDTVLTIDFIADAMQAHDDDLLAFARAIEQAVLQSAEVQRLRKDAERAAEYQKLVEGAAAVLANSAEEMEEGVPNECLAHEARSMAQTILFALPGDAAMEMMLLMVRLK